MIKYLVLKILPIPNILFFLALVAWIVIAYKKKDGPGYKTKLSLFWRSLIILLITTFFAYGTPKFTLYYQVLVSLNSPDEYLASNLKMHRFTKLTEDALNNSDCDQAIAHAESGLHNGYKWLGILGWYKKQLRAQIISKFSNANLVLKIGIIWVPMLAAISIIFFIKIVMK